MGRILSKSQTNINQKCNINREMKSRIEQAKQTFLDMKNVFIRSELRLSSRVRMVRCYIFSILVYGCEKKLHTKSGNGKQNHVFKDVRIQKNAEDSTDSKSDKYRIIINTLEKKTLQYLGHIMRGEKYEILWIKPWKEKSREKGRSLGRCNCWQKDIRLCLRVCIANIFRTAVSKIRIALWIANLI